MQACVSPVFGVMHYDMQSVHPVMWAALFHYKAAGKTQLGLFTQWDRESAVLRTQWAAIIPVW